MSFKVIVLYKNKCKKNKVIFIHKNNLTKIKLMTIINIGDKYVKKRKIFRED